MELFVEYMLFIQILFVIVIPFICVVISGSIARGIFWTWFLFALWYILLLGLSPQLKSIGADYVDGPELGIVIVFGWALGIPVALLAMLCRWLFLMIRRLLRKKTNEDIQSALEEHGIYYNEK